MSRKGSPSVTTRLGNHHGDSPSDFLHRDWKDVLANAEGQKLGVNRFNLPPSPAYLPSPNEAIYRLQQIDWAFSNTSTSDLTHALHPYPAKFPPALPAAIISQLSLPGELVLDPFGGSGTTAVEALVLGRRCISVDVNPLSEIIGRAKTVSLGLRSLNILNELANTCLAVSRSGNASMVVESANGRLREFIPKIPNIHKWFSPNVVRELAYLRWRISTLSDVDAQVVALCIFSNIVVRVSFQDGETRYASKPWNVPDGFALQCFGRELTQAVQYLHLSAQYFRMRTAQFFTADLRTTDPASACSVDLIVTSPPYPNATDYHLYHRFRLFWLGFDPRALSSAEIGSHLRHQREDSGADQYLKEMKQCLERCYRVLRPGRYAAFVVGDGLYKGRIFDTASNLSKVAQEIGFEVVTAFDRPLPEHRRSFVPEARRAERETVLLLRKPDRLIKVRLIPSAYTRWPYEDELRRKEAKILVEKAGGQILDNELVQIPASGVPELRRLTFTRAIIGPECSELLTWQAILENGHQPALRKDSKYATHGLHPYKGKFYPQLVKSLLNLLSLESGATILDPFVGSGTTTLEAYLNGYKARGVDLSPLAAEIADVKIAILSVDPLWLQNLLDSHIREIQQLNGKDDPWPPEVRREVENWFPPLVVRKLECILEGIRRVPDPIVQRFLRLVLSGLLRRCSQQEPADLRIRRRAKPIEDAPLIEEYVAAVEEHHRRLLHFAERFGNCPYVTHPAVIWTGDTRDITTFYDHGVIDGSVDAIITSPPYATALPYIDTDRLSFMALWGLTGSERARLEKALIGSREISVSEREALEKRIESGKMTEIPSSLAHDVITRIYELNKEAQVGFRRRNMAALLYRYFQDMTTTFRVWDRLLDSRGKILIVIGDNRTVAGSNIEVAIPTTQILSQIADAIGWRVREAINITVTKESLLHVKNTITKNTVLWFEKPC